MSATGWLNSLCNLWLEVQKCNHKKKGTIRAMPLGLWEPGQTGISLYLHLLIARTFSTPTVAKCHSLCISRRWRSDLSLFNLKLLRKRKSGKYKQMQKSTCSWEYKILQKCNWFICNMFIWLNLCIYLSGHGLKQLALFFFSIIWECWQKTAPVRLKLC